MSTASLELCKELYGLSGWTDTDKQWRGTNITKGVVGEYVLGKSTDKYAIPAYELGYLLRKLPPATYIYKKKSSKPHNGGIGQYTASLSKLDIKCNADTPEDAVCKLAIELIKQEVIKP